MNYQYIEQLLERYWLAETTIEEESILKTFFSQTELPEEMKRYQPLFAYEQRSAKEDVLDEAFEDRLLSRLGIEREEQPVVKARTIKMSSRLMPLFRAAAVIAIILTLGNAMQMPFADNGYFPPTAYEQAQEGSSMAMNVDTLKASTDSPLVSQATDTLTMGRLPQ